MKKFTLTLFVLMFFAVVANSQTQVKVAFGLNTSRLTTDEGKWSNEARLGWQVGGSWLIGNKFYVEPGIFYASISSDLENKNNASLNFTSKIDMFRVPVFVGYHLLGNASESFFNLRIFGGPTGSFITRVEESTALTKDDFSKVLWGVDAGVGINVWWIFLDVGYEWGLNNVFSHDEHGSAKERALWANVGVRFNL